jgi:hypothetical protein
MYDQYDYFNLSLNSIATANSGAISTDRNNLSLYVRMSGLAWSNCSYNVKTGLNSQYAVIAPFIFIPNNITLELYSNNVLTFGKNSDITSITIDFMRINDDTIATPTTAYPSHIYLFDIVGVPKTLYLKNN